MKTFSLAGVWTVSAEDGVTHNLKIPGTLDESNIGHRDKKNPEHGLMETLGSAASMLDRVFTDEELVFEDELESDPDENIYSRYTRKYTYEGPVQIYRMLSCRENPGKRLVLDIERARGLTLSIDGQEVTAHRTPTLLSEQCFEVTGLLDGSHILSLKSDNSYAGLPREAVLRSNMASDDTVTNWNGLLGYVRLRQEEACFIERLVVYPQDGSLSVYVEISCAAPGSYDISFSSPALEREYSHRMTIPEHFFCFTADGLKLKEGLQRWDEDEGCLYELTAAVNGEGRTVSFGIREFTADDQYLYLNGRRVFLRGQTDCSVHPDTSYPPMDKDAWLKKLRALRNYGINFVRFKTHCPPDAAFSAADELGMLLMSELSLAGPDDVFRDEKARRYYKSELLQLLRTYGNHPSFVMLSLGDGLRFSAESLDFAAELKEQAKRIDPSRLYTLSSGEAMDENGLAFDAEREKKYFDACDFLMIPGSGVLLFRGTDPAFIAAHGLKGFVNNEYPGTEKTYDEELEEFRERAKKPVVSYEAGGAAVLPDFGEISFFSAFLEPKNMMKMRDDAEAQGLLTNWDRYTAVSGQTARLAYRMEIERALSSRLLAGFTLFSLQDYPGRGSAFVGMMNAHLLPKPYPFADAKDFSCFCSPLVPLVRTERFCLEAGERLRFRVSVANFTKEDLAAPISYTLSSDAGTVKGRLEDVVCPAGELTDIEEETELALLPEDAIEPKRFTLTIRADRRENSYDFYVFPRVLPFCPMDVYESDTLNQTAVLMLKEGGKVLLTPRASAEILPLAVRSEFSTDFVSNLLYPHQSGEMGRLLDLSHPVLSRFPADEWGGISWWQFSCGRAVLLPRRMKCIVSALDSINTLRPMAEMLEFRCLSGTVFLCSSGLKDHMDRPEVRFLVSEIYRYMDSYDFSPSQEMKLSELSAIVKP